MKLEGDQRLLRVFVGERDKWDGLPLYEAWTRRQTSRSCSRSSTPWCRKDS